MNISDDKNIKLLEMAKALETLFLEYFNSYIEKYELKDSESEILLIMASEMIVNTSEFIITYGKPEDFITDFSGKRKTIREAVIAASKEVLGEWKCRAAEMGKS